MPRRTSALGLSAAMLPSGPRWFLAAALFFLLLGIFFRVYGLGDRNLWTDEAWVALAACQPTPSAALAAGKSTPPFYLLTVWGVVQVLGTSEAALRLLSVVLGIGALVLFWPLANLLLPPGQALCAFALVSLSHRLVYFSKELKQYSADVFFVTLALLLVEQQRRRGGRGGWLLLTLLLALGLGYSYPLMFVLPVAAVVLWRELPGARRQIAWSFGALAASFAALYLTLIRGQVDPQLLIYWQADFPDLSGLGAFFTWLGSAWWRFGGYFFPDWRVIPGALLAAAGLAAAVRGGSARLLWYFLGPLLVALAAGFAHRYPYMGRAGGVRLMLFAAPMLYLATGAGLGEVLQRLWLWASRGDNRQEGQPESDGRGAGRSAKPVLALGLALLAVLAWLRPIFLWQENLWPTLNREELAPLVRYVEAHRRPGEAIYLYYFAIDPFTFYYRGPWTDIIWGQSCHDCGLPLPAGRLRQIRRLWLVFSHYESEAQVEQFIHRLLGEGWTRELVQTQPGALLFRYRPPWSVPEAAANDLRPPGPE